MGGKVLRRLVTVLFIANSTITIFTMGGPWIYCSALHVAPRATQEFMLVTVHFF